MTEPFFIPISYKGVERNFNAELKVFGYTSRFVVDVDGAEVYFEPDEEGSYRAVIPYDADMAGFVMPDIDLLKIIQAKIEEILE
jgi:hypothetical protein